MSAETQIDWTKPVQTKETPPRKVRILTTEAAGYYPVIGNVEGEETYRSFRLNGGYRVSVPDELDLENTPEWKLPDPPEGQQWHRNDWTEEMLPADYRPLLLNELPHRDDELLSYAWIPINICSPALKHEKHQRTTRPLPQQPEQWVAEKAAFAAGDTIQFRCLPETPDWIVAVEPKWLSDLEYRIKPKPQKVPIGPEDVPPGSVFRMIKNSGKSGFTAAIGCNEAGVILLDASLTPQTTSFAFLKENAQIKRPTDTDWKPCYKEVNHD